MVISVVLVVPTLSQRYHLTRVFPRTNINVLVSTRTSFILQWGSFKHIFFIGINPTEYSTSPDDETFKKVALTYSKNHPRMGDASTPG
jgi:hypothetical protein